MRVDAVMSEYGLDDGFTRYASTGVETIVRINGESWIYLVLNEAEMENNQHVFMLILHIY